VLFIFNDLNYFSLKIFFYSHQIFKNAQLAEDLIQYAILSTGLVNVLATLISIPLIEKLGRRPLVIYPVAIMIINFVSLVLLLNFKVRFMFIIYNFQAVFIMIYLNLRNILPYLPI
jgi:MFS family permease